MAKTLSTLLAGAVIAVFLGGLSGEPQIGAAFQGGPAGSAAGIITHVVPRDGQPTELVIVDTNHTTVAVYHITAEKGEIQFRSERNFRWDLQLMQFNSTEAFDPEEVQKMLQRVGP